MTPPASASRGDADDAETTAALLRPAPRRPRAARGAAPAGGAGGRSPLPLAVHAFGGAADRSVDGASLARWAARGAEAAPPPTLLAGGHFYHEEAASRAAPVADVAHRALGALGARPASAAVGPPLAPPERHVHEMVCEWAARTPDAPALVDGATALSYAELAADARLLACWLVAAGARPRTVVGCLMEHRAEAVVAQLAAGLSGAAFFGMETHFGPKMLAELLEQSRPVALLASAATRARRGRAADDNGALLDVDAGWREAAAAAAAAVAPPEAWARAAPYDGGIITMTSGTSGKPKAIVCPHAAYAHAAAARRARHPYAAGGGYGGEREGST